MIVTNVDQLLIIASAAEPNLKPNLIDRFLVTAEKAAITPIICINKIDLVAVPPTAVGRPYDACTSALTDVTTTMRSTDSGSTRTPALTTSRS